MLNELHTFLLGQLTKSGLIDQSGNIHDLTTESYAKPTANTNSDFPSLELVLVSLSGPLEATSSHKTFAVVYDVQLKSGQKNIAPLQEMLWTLVQRVCHINTNRGIFEYKSTRPLTKVTLLDTPVGIFLDNTVAGFSSVSKLRADVYVQNSLVIPPPCDDL